MGHTEVSGHAGCAFSYRATTEHQFEAGAAELTPQVGSPNAAHQQCADHIGDMGVV
jgi:hypothetical protein